MCVCMHAQCLCVYINMCVFVCVCVHMCMNEPVESLPRPAERLLTKKKKIKKM